jgi:hypothetical protein
MPYVMMRIKISPLPKYQKINKKLIFKNIGG